MMEQKSTAVKTLTNGIAHLFKQNKVIFWCSWTSIIHTLITQTISLVPILSWMFISHDQDP